MTRKYLRAILTGLSNVFDGGLGTAFAGKNQDFLQAGGGDGCHLFFDFFRGQLRPADFVVAVETAVNAVVFTVVCDIDWGEHIYAVSEMFAVSFWAACAISSRSGKAAGEKCVKIFRSAVVMC